MANLPKMGRTLSTNYKKAISRISETKNVKLRSANFSNKKHKIRRFRSISETQDINIAQGLSNKEKEYRHEYLKMRRKIKLNVARLEKRGYIFPKDIIPNKPKRYTQQMVQETTRKNINWLYKQAKYIDWETNEVITGEERRKQERKEARRKTEKTRQRKRKEREKQGIAEPPSEGDTSWYNVFNEFITKVSQPTPETTPTYRYQKKQGRNRFGQAKKWKELYEASDEGRKTLLSITNNVLSTEGSETLGFRLQENADTVSQLIDYVLYGSDATKIASAVSILAEIITDKDITMSDRQDLGDEQEYNENWDIEDEYL